MAATEGEGQRSTPAAPARPAGLSVQIIVYSGKGAGAQPHTGHEPQALRGLAQGQHQRGLLWQVLRFCGGKERAVQKRCSGCRWLTCTQASLHPSWAPSPDPWQKVLALEGSDTQILPAQCCCCSTHPTSRDAFHSSAGPLRECCCGGQSNKKVTKLLLMLVARKPSKHEKSKHGGIRKGRRIWPHVRGNLSISPTCARLHSSPSPGSIHSLIIVSLQ